MTEGDILSQMKADWDRRVAHDSRFWMSDGHDSDQAMWASGARDFGIITRGLYPNSATTLLDLGCGVGRLLKSALLDCGHVIGVDVSDKAVSKAKDLLGFNPRLSLHVISGKDLYPVPDASIDILVSFATLGSVPADICAAYLPEIWRVLKSGGDARLQMYTGLAQQVRRDDTLNLRSYEEVHLRAALELSGFEVQTIEELTLPIKVSFEELGFKAVVVGLKKGMKPPAEPKLIAATLLPTGEPATIDPDAATNFLEFWMSVNYAKELADRGDVERVKRTLEYAVGLPGAGAIDISEILHAISVKVGQEAVKSVLEREPRAASPVVPAALSTFERNIELVRGRWPEAGEALRKGAAVGRGGDRSP